MNAYFRRLKVLAFCFCINSLSCFAAGAAPASGGGLGDNSKPIEISSDSLEVMQETNKAIFTGHVVAIQGDMRLKSDRMTVYYRKIAEGEDTKKDTAAATQQGAIAKIDVEGNVFMATPKDTAKGDSGVYDVDKREVRLFNNVVLTQGQNVLKGNALNYNLDTGRSKVTSAVNARQADTAKPEGRVHMLIIPDKKESRAK